MLVSTDSHSQSAQGCAESHVIAVPGPGWDASVPVPTRNWKSTDTLLGDALTGPTTASSLPFTKGLAMQLPNVVGLIWDDVVIVRPDRHSRAACTPKNLPATPSTWTLIVVPSTAPVIGPGGAIVAAAGATAAFVTVSGLPIVSAWTRPMTTVTTHTAARSSALLMISRSARLRRAYAIRVSSPQSMRAGTAGPERHYARNVVDDVLRDSGRNPNPW
jgi:hypothetical protein